MPTRSKRRRCRDFSQAVKLRPQLLPLVLVSVLGTSISSAATDDPTTCAGGTPEIAIAACTRIISAGTSSTSELVLVYSFRGLHFEQKGQFDKALADFDRAIQLDPKSAVPYGGRGAVYLEKGDYDRAISAFSEAIRLAPPSAMQSLASDYSFRGDAHLKKGQRDLAFRDYNSAIKINPTSDVAFAGRGQAYFDAGDYDHAIEDFGTAIRLDPTGPHPYLIRGRSYAKKGEFDRALVDMNSAIDLKHPNLAFAYLVRGDAYESRGNLQKALADYRSAVNAPKPADPGLSKEIEVGIQRVNKKLAALNDTPQIRSSATSVAMQSDGGVYAVPVLINGTITLDFVVDSGAADVSIPADVVSTLIRTKTLKESDFTGRQTYVLADGSKVPSQTFRIKSLKVGDKVIEDVTASVASVNGSLLLGQSFLSRLKSWSIDNTKHALVFE